MVRIGLGKNADFGHFYGTGRRACQYPSQRDVARVLRCEVRRSFATNNKIDNGSQRLERVEIGCFARQFIEQVNVYL